MQFHSSLLKSESGVESEFLLQSHENLLRCL